jgi:hypothetical protein
MTSASGSLRQSVRLEVPMGGPIRFVATLCLAAALAAAGCAGKFKKQEKAIEAQPVNCATAQGDLRLLQHEKAHVAEQIALGIEAIYPASAVVGLLTGTEKTKFQVATGEYNGLIDKKMAEIKSTCGL